MRILVALGGNAILQRKERGTAQEQFSNVQKACIHLAEVAKKGHQIVVTHGNGPQVGDILLKDEMAEKVLPRMPLDVCGAESQGMIGYMIQRSLRDELRRRGMDVRVATVLTETVVDQQDSAFSNPSKPVGPFYTEQQASRLGKERGWTMVNDSGRGYRRVVPSPKPLSIVQAPVVKTLVEEGVVVIAAGGGGIPVALLPDGSAVGVEAVIDKDLGAAVLASLVDADMLLMLTDVENVFLDYGKPTVRPLRRVTSDECRKYLEDGQFAPGSMGPKVQAALEFIASGGRFSVITSLENAREAVSLRKGTVVVP